MARVGGQIFSNMDINDIALYIAAAIKQSKNRIGTFDTGSAYGLHLEQLCSLPLLNQYVH